MSGVIIKLRMEDVTSIAKERHDELWMRKLLLGIIVRIYSASRGKKEKMLQLTVHSASSAIKKRFQKYGFLCLTMKFLLNGPRINPKTAFLFPGDPDVQMHLA